MGLLCEYFLADSDDIAASVSESGPEAAAAPTVAAPPRRRWFGRAAEAAAPLSPPPVFSVVDGCGVEPTVQMRTLEALLTGRRYEDLVEEPGYPHLVASGVDGGPMVERLPESFVSALAGASDERLAEVAVPWAQTEEFWGLGEPDVLAVLLCDLAALAREAAESDKRLYCWVSL